MYLKLLQREQFKKQQKQYNSSQNNSEENIQNDSEIHKEKCNYVGEK